MFLPCSLTLPYLTAGILKVKHYGVKILRSQMRCRLHVAALPYQIFWNACPRCGTVAVLLDSCLSLPTSSEASHPRPLVLSCSSSRSSSCLCHVLQPVNMKLFPHLVLAPLVAGRLSQQLLQPQAVAEPSWHFNYSSSAPHYFASVHGLLQQWTNTFFPNGHSVVPCEIPAFTKLYHGRMDGEVPPSPEWVAFDA